MVEMKAQLSVADVAAARPNTAAWVRFDRATLG
jgi:hypothetical protein